MRGGSGPEQTKVFKLFRDKEEEPHVLRYLTLYYKYTMWQK